MEIVVPFTGVLITGAVAALIVMALAKAGLHLMRRAYRRRRVAKQIDAAAMAAFEPLINRRKSRFRLPFRRKESVWVPLRRKP